MIWEGILSAVLVVLVALVVGVAGLVVWLSWSMGADERRKKK